MLPAIGEQPITTLTERDFIEPWPHKVKRTQCDDWRNAQEARAAARFALCVLAGEMAITAGVLPWPQGEALATRDAFIGHVMTCRACVTHSQKRPRLCP